MLRVPGTDLHTVGVCLQVFAVERGSSSPTVWSTGFPRDAPAAKCSPINAIKAASKLFTRKTVGKRVLVLLSCWLVGWGEVVADTFDIHAGGQGRPTTRKKKKPTKKNKPSYFLLPFLILGTSRQENFRRVSEYPSLTSSSAYTWIYQRQ